MILFVCGLDSFRQTSVFQILIMNGGYLPVSSILSVNNYPLSFPIGYFVFKVNVKLLSESFLYTIGAD